MMSPMDFFQAVGVIATAGAAVATAWIKIGKPLIEFIKKTKKMFDVVESISEQFSPNGGSSLRDAINRIEARQIVQEQRHKMLTMDAPFAIYETGPEGDFIDVNRTYCRWVGRSPSEIVGKGWVNSIAPLWRHDVTAAWEQSVSQQREFNMKYRLVDTDDETIPVFSTAFPLYDTKKKLVGWVGIIYKSDDVIPEDPSTEKP